MAVGTPTHPISCSLHAACPVRIRGYRWALGPLALLGAKVAVGPLSSPGDACTGATFKVLGPLVAGHGGEALRGLALTEELFDASEMVAGADVAFSRR